MSRGLRTVWERGPRTGVTTYDRGVRRPMLGKNGGPIIRQTVVKRLVPKGTRR